MSTRVLPPSVASTLMSDIVGTVSVDRRAPLILDIGCGCGRLLRGLEHSNQKFEAIGVDISERMLLGVNPIVRQSQRIKLQLGDCQQTELFKPKSFDLIIMHWVLNTTEGWENIVRNASVWVKDEGVIAWFDEESNLYDAIDGGVMFYGNNSCSEFEIEFWNRWYENLGGDETATTLKKRLGLSMKSSQQELALDSVGFKTRRLACSKQTWAVETSMNWILDQVLTKRAFSNFWKIPDKKYEKSLYRVRSFLSRYNDTHNIKTKINFRSVPVLAFRS